ncbi:hypothetical protein [Legionella bononiensis]|nr:hypothetical protein [Legionella bononiensis]MBL7481228.1 hypothetical protein [Legionella bononiensis]
MPSTPPGSPKPERSNEQTSPPRNPNTLFGHTPHIYRCAHNHIHMIDMVDGELIFLTFTQFPELTPFVMLASIIQDLDLSDEDTEDYYREEDADEVTAESSTNEKQTEPSDPLPAPLTKEEQELEEDQEEDVLRSFRSMSM